MSTNLDPTLCKKMVYASGMWHSYQYTRKIWKDEYCKQHHPETVAERNKKADEKWQQKQLESLPYQY